MSDTTGPRIRARRKELGLTQGDVAQRVGVTKAAISQWESGAAQVLGKNLVKLASALETSAPWLMGSGADASSNNPIDADRIERILTLLDALPKSVQASISLPKRAKLIAYLYGRDLSAIKVAEISELMILLK